MKTRTTVLLDTDLMDRLRSAARYRSVPVTTVIHEAVSEYLAHTNVNPGLVNLIGMADELPRTPDGSTDVTDELAAEIYEDAMGHADGGD